MSNRQSSTESLFWNSHQIRQIDDHWYQVPTVDRMAAFRSRFKPRSDDILLTTFRKTGTTWLKALCYNILNREAEEDLLAKKNPHKVVPTLENTFLEERFQDMLLSSPPTGRLLHSHLPYSYLPEARGSPGAGSCTWLGIRRTRGVLPFGPFYEHVVGYWEESRRRPQEVLFLKYKELYREPKEQARKLASFLGKPFSLDGDEEVEKVLWRSSLDRLKELEVNTSGVGELNHVLNSTFFRRGTVRDWENYLTPEMAQRIDHLTQSKLQGTGLTVDD
ncbi:unnamed protein product [Linum tenue]|uniref:Sulfotransferase n=1 Tax=Linum tenue TaxID=586396 RepID=A0AAV0RKD1_9ROSI|nr:unnamed protein product [Linum tenue]